MLNLLLSPSQAIHTLKINKLKRFYKKELCYPDFRVSTEFCPFCVKIQRQRSKFEVIGCLLQLNTNLLQNRHAYIIFHEGVIAPATSSQEIGRRISGWKHRAIILLKVSLRDRAVQ